jgi:hypothetical protein
MSDNSTYAMLATPSSPSTMPRKAHQLRRYLIWAAIVSMLNVGVVIYLKVTDIGEELFSARDMAIFRISGAVSLLVVLLSIIGVVLLNKRHAMTKLVSFIVAIAMLPSLPVGTAIGAGILISLFSKEVRDHLSPSAPDDRDGPLVTDPGRHSDT